MLRIGPEVSPFEVRIAGEKMCGFVHGRRLLQKTANGNEGKEESKNAQDNSRRKHRIRRHLFCGHFNFAFGLRYRLDDDIQTGFLGHKGLSFSGRKSQKYKTKLYGKPGGERG